MQQNDNLKSMEWALWRFGILSPLLHAGAEGKTHAEIFDELEAKQWLRPDGRLVHVDQETIRKWLYRYRVGGLPALDNQKRQDRHKIPDTLAQALFDLRLKHPRLTIKCLLDQLQKQGTWNGIKPSRSALYRFTDAHNLQRDPVRPTTGRAFVFDAFGQLWVADFLHGPKLRVKRKKVKTYLHAIMDDCTRYVVQAAFSTSESTQTLMGELHLAIRRFGIPLSFYVDNGASYSSRHLQIVCGRMGTRIHHTPPYQPKGRGKIERFFRSVRDQFLATVSVRTLEELNAAFQAWLADYHQRPHRILECPPLEKRLQVRQAIKPPPETLPLEAMFRMERRCRVYADGTIRFKNRLFEVPGCEAQSRVVIYYTPWDLSRVYYGDDHRLARPLDAVANAQRFQHPHSPKETNDE